MDNKHRDITKIVIFLLLLIIMLASDFAQWDIINIITERYNWMVSGLFYYFMAGIRVVTLIGLLLWTIKHMKSTYKQSIFRAIIPAVAFLTAFALQYIFPFTETYMKLEYEFNSNVREQIVLMFKEGNVSNLIQIDENVYILPFSLRLASKDAKIETSYTGTTLKIAFCANKSIVNSRDVVYVSDMSSIGYKDFYKKYKNIKQINGCWYLAEY